VASEGIKRGIPAGTRANESRAAFSREGNFSRDFDACTETPLVSERIAICAELSSRPDPEARNDPSRGHGRRKDGRGVFFRARNALIGADFSR